MQARWSGGFSCRAQGPQVLCVWLLPVLRDLMDRKMALEHLATYVLAVEPPRGRDRPR